MNKFLFKRIDNINLVLFRVVFGLLITTEAIGAIATGWVNKVLIEPDFTFHFIGFDFLQYIQGEWMDIYFLVMGIFGIGVMLGYKYRISMLAYAVLWSGVYFMQKTAYNNHYYLLMLLCWIMVFLPAHRSLSLDAKYNPKLKSNGMSRWVLVVLIFQIWIIYTYAALNKFYPGWLDGSAIAAFMAGKVNYPIIGKLLQQKWVHFIMIYSGILYDLLIVPLLLWKRTRIAGLIASLAFHLSNSIIFQIGIFPYLSIAFCLFFFTPETLRKRFLPSRELYRKKIIHRQSNKQIWIGLFSVYFLFQIGLPLRHHFFKDDVLWTEEGHRMSWRMMLRAKRGTLTVYVWDKNSGERRVYNYAKILSPYQQSAVRSHPDLLWQLAQKIKELEAKEGREVSVFMDSKVSINNGPFHQFTDVTVDLAAEKWYHFKHHDWILPSPPDYRKPPEVKDME